MNSEKKNLCVFDQRLMINKIINEILSWPAVILESGMEPSHRVMLLLVFGPSILSSRFLETLLRGHHAPKNGKFLLKNPFFPLYHKGYPAFWEIMFADE
jgi:hypothetical protein